MRWDVVLRDVNQLENPALIKAVVARSHLKAKGKAKGMSQAHYTRLKVKRMSKTPRAPTDPKLLAFYLAVAYGLNDFRAIEQLRALKNSKRTEHCCCEEWAHWLEPHDIPVFAHMFGLWERSHWYGPAFEAVKARRNAELAEILKLTSPNGLTVIDISEDGYLLMWDACSSGNTEAFDMLWSLSDFIPLSDFDRYACFIFAVQNNHGEVAQKILRKCEERDEWEKLRYQMDEYARREEENPHNKDCGEKFAPKIYAWMEHFQIHNSLKMPSQKSPSRLRKI